MFQIARHVPNQIGSSRTASVRSIQHGSQHVPHRVSRYSVVSIKVPSMGDSISEGTLESWTKKVDDVVKADDLVAKIETDKVTVDIRAPQAGKIVEQCAKDGDVVMVGSDLYKLDTSVTASDAAPAKEAPKEAPKEASKPKEEAKPAAPQAQAKPTEAPKKAEPSKPADTQKAAAPTNLTPTQHQERANHRVKMNRIRQTISKRLKEAQNTYAMLTTFNDIDMSALMALRTTHNDEFQERHGVKMGFMSPFIKACTIALKEVPAVNAVIDDASKEVIYRLCRHLCRRGNSKGIGRPRRS